MAQTRLWFIALLALVLAAAALSVGVHVTGSCDTSGEIYKVIDNYYGRVSEKLLEGYENTTVELEFTDPPGYARVEPVSFLVRYEDGGWEPVSMDTGRILGWLEKVFPDLVRQEMIVQTGNGTLGSSAHGSVAYGYMWNYTITVPLHDGCRALRFIVATSATWRFNSTMPDREFIVAYAFFDEEGNLIGRDYLVYMMFAREGEWKLIGQSTAYPGCAGTPPLRDANGDGSLEVRSVVVVYAPGDPGPGQAVVGVYALGYLVVDPCG